MKKALIVNEGFSSNLGDQAIRQSMQALFTDLGYETSFAYFSSPALREMPVYNYNNAAQAVQPSGKARSLITTLTAPLIMLRYFFRLQKAVRNVLMRESYDIICIGGGQLINSTSAKPISFFAIALYVWTLSARQLKTPVFLIGIGAAKSFHRFEKFIYRRAIRSVKNIWVRDVFSQLQLNSQFGKDAVVIPDVAFYSTGEVMSSPKQQLALVGIYGYDEFMKSHATQLQSRETYYETWLVIIEEYLHQGLTVKLFYTTETDAAECYLFADWLKSRSINADVAGTPTLEALLVLLGSSSHVYSARMHALILAYKFDCEVSPFLISQKLQSFADEWLRYGLTPQQLSIQVKDTLQPYFVSLNAAS